MQEFEQEEAIEYGEFLRENMVEKLTMTLDYIAAHEELKMIRVIHTEEEEVIWRQKHEHKEELMNQLQKNSDDQIDIIKILLEKYNMRYTEKADKGIKYYYKSKNSIWLRNDIFGGQGYAGNSNVYNGNKRRCSAVYLSGKSFK